MSDVAKRSTDRVLWVESSDWKSPILFVTADHLIGMDVGGHVILKSIHRWHALALKELEPSPVRMPYSASADTLDRGLATGRLIEEAERLIRTIEDHRKKAVRELPIAPLLAAVERAKGLG